MTRIKFEKDTPISMRDGLKLAANIYRPDKPGRYPVIMAFTGFGKDGFWAERHFGWQVAYESASPTVTGSITFEANDPAYWVPHEYAVIIADPRGFGRSPGQMPTADLDGAVGEHALIHQGMWARDMFDAVEWAGTQEWSNGNVGLSGVSILAFSQWRVAGLNPPHLKAINPWEAMTDFYRDVMFPGGIPETKFTRRITRSMSARNGPDRKKRSRRNPLKKRRMNSCPTLRCRLLFAAPGPITVFIPEGRSVRFERSHPPTNGSTPTAGRNGRNSMLPRQERFESSFLTIF